MKKLINTAFFKKMEKTPGFVNKMFNVLEKNADKYSISGKSGYGMVQIKLSPTMNIRKIIIDPDVVIDKRGAPEESMDYLRNFCRLVEGEVLAAYNDAQKNIYKKAKITTAENEKKPAI